jgi:integrase
VRPSHYVCPEPSLLILYDKRQYKSSDCQILRKETYNVVKAILRRSGVLEGKAEDLRIATHTLRKTFSTLALHAGCDGRIADRLLRHRKGDVGSLYFAMPMDALRRNLERCSQLAC